MGKAKDVINCINHYKNEKDALYHLLTKSGKVAFHGKNKIRSQFINLLHFLEIAVKNMDKKEKVP